MIKKVLAVLLFALILAQPAMAANYLINPGYENGLNDWTDLWGYPSEVVTNVKHSGTYAINKFVGNVDTEYWSQVYQEVALNAGQPVYAQIYARSTFSPKASAKAGLMVQFMDANDNVLGTTLNSSTIGGTVSWRLLEVSAKSAPAGTKKARLSGYLWAKQGDTVALRNGFAYFDDARLDKIYQAPKLQASLYNKGFENGLHDWTDLYGYPSALVSANFHTGTYSARKKVETVSTQDYWSQIYQEIACTAGKKVTGGVWIKTIMKPVAKAKAGLQVEALNASNKVLKSASTGVGGQTDWRKLTLIINPTPAGTVKVRISGYIYAPKGDVNSVGGSAFYDDAALTITTP